MNGKPETLAEIAAEIRRGERMFWSLRDCASYADRIEAAAERERDEDRQLAAIAESDEAFARCARCDRPERAPGNAAAMREALERIVKLAPEYPADGVDWNALAAEVFLAASSALVAPARNCDRFATYEEAVEAYRAWAERTTGDVSNVSGRGMLGWLFAPAEDPRA